MKKVTLEKVKPLYFWSAIAFLIVIAGLISFSSQQSSSVESKTKSITSQLRCLECEGLSVADSETPTSKTIIADVEKRVKEGQSKEEIFNYYEGVYGEFIRLAPTGESGNWLIYVVPVFFVAVFIVAIYLSISSKATKKIQIVFWALSGILFVLGIVFFVTDSNSSVKQAEKSIEKTNEEILLESVAESPNNSNLRSLAIVQFANENYVEALKNFDRAAELDENDATSRGYAAYIVFISEQYEIAQQRADLAVQANPEDPTALFFRGLIYFQTPESNQEIAAENKRLANLDFDAVLELAPGSEFARQINEVRN